MKVDSDSDVLHNRAQHSPKDAPMTRSFESTWIEIHNGLRSLHQINGVLLQYIDFQRKASLELNDTEIQEILTAPTGAKDIQRMWEILSPSSRQNIGRVIRVAGFYDAMEVIQMGYTTEIQALSAKVQKLVEIQESKVWQRGNVERKFGKEPQETLSFMSLHQICQHDLVDEFVKIGQMIRQKVQPEMVQRDLSNIIPRDTQIETILDHAKEPMSLLQDPSCFDNDTALLNITTLLNAATSVYLVTFIEPFFAMVDCLDMCKNNHKLLLEQRFNITDGLATSMVLEYPFVERFLGLEEGLNDIDDLNTEVFSDDTKEEDSTKEDDVPDDLEDGEELSRKRNNEHQAPIEGFDVQQQ